MFKKLFPLVLVSLFIVSCVPYRKLEDETMARKSAESAKIESQMKAAKMKIDLDSLSISYSSLKESNKTLVYDTTVIRASLREYLRLDAENKKRMDQLSKTTDRILDANLSENERLQNKINEQKKDLEKQKAELENRIFDFEKTKKEYDEARGALSTKDQKIADLQEKLENQKKMAQALKNAVSEALTGFSSTGLNVVEKQGKVYVLLPESLLFKSGSKELDAKGKDALKQLTSVLLKNPDIQVAVEGHTDNVPYAPSSKTSLVNDNWDLSALRATSVVKVLINLGISPIRVYAQGRGEYFPIDSASTKEARTLNRRTEIILSPKLDEVLKTLE